MPVRLFYAIGVRHFKTEVANIVEYTDTFIEYNVLFPVDGWINF